VHDVMYSIMWLTHSCVQHDSVHLTACIYLMHVYVYMHIYVYILYVYIYLYM